MNNSIFVVILFINVKSISKFKKYKHFNIQSLNITSFPVTYLITYYKHTICLNSNTLSINANVTYKLTQLLSE